MRWLVLLLLLVSCTRETYHDNDCLRKAAVYSLESIGMAGSLEPDYYIDINGTDVAYLYYSGESRVPAVRDFEQQSSKVAAEAFRVCADAEKVTMLSSFTSDKASFFVYYMNGTKVEYAATDVRFQFFEIYDLASEIVRRTSEDPRWIDYTLLSESRIPVDVHKLGNSTLVYEFKKPLGIDADTYRYRFAVKYR